jgi:hypothetical protein
VGDQNWTDGIPCLWQGCARLSDLRKRLRIRVRIELVKGVGEGNEEFWLEDNVDRHHHCLIRELAAKIPLAAHDGTVLGEELKRFK